MKKKWLRRIARFFVAAATLGAVLAFIGAVMAFVVVRQFEANLPSIEDLKGNYHPPQVTRVLARDGSLLAELFTERRTVIPIAQIPPHVKLAVLAAEDANFYEHEGVNYLGILRAAVKNLRPRRMRQGGSTITQQVVKNLLLDNERTYKRKLREVLLARRLEQELSKEEILELYLNHIYFGRGRYGIEEAARDSFGKSAHDLTIAEGAMLAGVVAAPETFSPRRDMQKALSRRSYVLKQMREKGFLNDEQFSAATDEPLRLAPPIEIRSELAAEAVEIARKTLNTVAPERAKKGGFTITTTIDPKLQAIARASVRENLAAYDRRHGLVEAMRAPDLPGKRNRRRGQPISPVFKGTPVFEAYRILTGVVVGSDDTKGTFDVQVGTVVGAVKLSDFPRYNPDSLPPSKFAPVGAKVRVSLLAPVPQAPDTSAAPRKGRAVPANLKVPLRLELGPESAFVAIDVRTRQVLALIGSYEGMSGMLDRATQARRQPGSTFKALVYSYAIHTRQFTPSTLVDPRPTEFPGGYKPRNFEGWTGEEPLRLREILANSVNVGAVHVLLAIGPAGVVDWAHQLGIKSTMQADLSLGLGSYEVKPIEMCGAFATFAAGGVYEEPLIVTRIVGPDGIDVPLPPRPAPVRVLDETEAYLMTSMMQSVVDHGTGVRARAVGRPVAGKTGTTNDSRDTWFAGYSTDIAAVTWVGYDDAQELVGELGGSAALPGWVLFMKGALANRPGSEFPQPPGLVTIAIDAKTGALPTPATTSVIDELFLPGTEPTEVAIDMDASAPLADPLVDAAMLGATNAVRRADENAPAPNR